MLNLADNVICIFLIPDTTAEKTWIVFDAVGFSRKTGIHDAQQVRLWPNPIRSLHLLG